MRAAPRGRLGHALAATGLRGSAATRGQPLAERPLASEPGLVALAPGGGDGREERLGRGARGRWWRDVRSDLLGERRSHGGARTRVEGRQAREELTDGQRERGGQRGDIGRARPTSQRRWHQGRWL